jgi:diaminohydroxyphosphoribosylaminopyrimidine deaminase/5-amino-6-(5-phosphoribosylamino)uracil reductase
MYVSLEPCCHSGRTGPCADAVIKAGIARIVVAMRDPNPLVAGQGIAKLRAAGIEVEVDDGQLAEEARKLNEAFAVYIRCKRPLVTLKAAMSLDGKIAARPVPANVHVLGAPSQASTSYITSQPALDQVHRLRHASDAILVGVGTVIADDPLLTDRSGLPRRRPLLRVILDSQLRLPLESRVVKTANEDVLVFCSFAEENKRRALESRGVIVQQVPLAAGELSSEPGPHEGRPHLGSVLAALGEMHITSLLVEGGAIVNWAFLRSGMVDKVMLFYAPKIFGPTGTVPWLDGNGGYTLADTLKLSNISVHRYGDDFAVEGYLRDPYSESIL